VLLDDAVVVPSLVPAGLLAVAEAGTAEVKVLARPDELAGVGVRGLVGAADADGVGDVRRANIAVEFDLEVSAPEWQAPAGTHCQCPWEPSAPRPGCG
jgi:hypothetical protein